MSFTSITMYGIATLIMQPRIALHNKPIRWYLEAIEKERKGQFKLEHANQSGDLGKKSQNDVFLSSLVIPSSI